MSGPPPFPAEIYLTKADRNCQWKNQVRKTSPWLLLPRSTNKEILRRDMSPQMKGATTSPGTKRGPVPCRGADEDRAALRGIREALLRHLQTLLKAWSNGVLE